MVWLYARRFASWMRRPLTIRFRFAPPVGTLSLRVRCNRGSDAFIFSEIFEHRYYDFDLPGSPRTILDAGANIGLAALFFARKYPAAELACVEPMPENVCLLEFNLHQNRVKASIQAKAVSTNDSPIIMQRAENDYGHKVANLAFGRDLTGKTLSVPAISIPVLMRELGWDRIGLLKLDVEGYEGVLLRERCEWLNRVDAICVECHEGFGEEDLRAVASFTGFSLPDFCQALGYWSERKASYVAR